MPKLLLLLLLLMAMAVIAYFYKSKPSKNDIALKQLNASKSSDVPQSLQNTDILSFLNEIDCAVLSNAGFDRVLEMFFSNLKAFVPCELVSVTQVRYWRC
jgi:hypothetical protein